MAKGSKPAGKSGGKKAMTKSALIAHLADKAGLDTTKKQVDAVLNALVATVVAEAKSTGKLVIPNLARVTVTHKPAVKGGETKINRLTNQPYTTKDKPAQTVIKLRPVKALKEAVNKK